jgi:hypothetical protein
MLAPPPDFRYVGFGPAPRLGPRFLAGVVGAGAGVGVSLLRALPPGGALVAATLAASGTALLLRRLRGPVPAWGTHTAPLGFVPWGVLVEDEAAPRVLRWAAIERVSLHVIYGRDGGTPSTLWSLVTVETARERFAGRTAGAAPLERLLAHLEAYTREAAAPVALDLDGERSGEGPYEPEFAPLLASARAWLESSPASSRLALPPASYRRTSTRAAGGDTLAVLAEILSSRDERAPDPRPFAAIVAAELGAVPLEGVLLELVQSPHPLLAAIAKVAARKLGAPTSRAGALDEVAPFLHTEDMEAMAAWAEGG